MREAFQRQLEYGQAGEYKIRDALLNAKSFVSGFHKTNRNDFELIKDGHTFRVEIKTDRAAARTGNLCIELLQGREQKPSGLAVSEAAVVVHYIPGKEHVAMYRRVQMMETLRMFVRSQKFRLKLVGDNYNQGVCFPITEFCEMGKVQTWIDYRPLSTIGASHLWGY